MRTLSSQEEVDAFHFMQEAELVAKDAFCFRSKCGSIIVKDNKIIGKGFNSPPENKKIPVCIKDDLPKDFKSDKTCCIHAEQRAIMDALRNNPNSLKDSRIYFIRLDNKNNKLFAGKPYCTICSKLALDVGISEFILWHKEGILAYDTQEYNELSFKSEPIHVQK